MHEMFTLVKEKSTAGLACAKPAQYLGQANKASNAEQHEIDASMKAYFEGWFTNQWSQEASIMRIG